jgi:large subunit ribosomal protein L21
MSKCTHGEGPIFFASLCGLARTRKENLASALKEDKSMYAVMETGGKQYRVQVGDVVQLESLPQAKGDSVVFDKVCMTVSDSEVRIGSPFVSGASVRAEILSHGRGEKILVFKYKSKKNIRKMKGHRQNYTEVVITEVIAG